MHGTTAAAVAVAWTLAWPGVTGAIVGARAPEQIDGWIEAATLDLGPADMGEIAAAITATGAGSGPALPGLTAASPCATAPRPLVIPVECRARDRSLKLAWVPACAGMTLKLGGRLAHSLPSSREGRDPRKSPQARR